MTFRVVLVDDHELVRSGLRRAFELADEFEVAGEAATVADAKSRIAAVRPDVATVDIRLPDGDGLELARQLRRSYPELGLVVLTMHAGDDQLLGALHRNTFGCELAEHECQLGEHQRHDEGRDPPQQREAELA